MVELRDSGANAVPRLNGPIPPERSSPGVAYLDPVEHLSVTRYLAAHQKITKFRFGGDRLGGGRHANFAVTCAFPARSQTARAY